MESKNSRLLFLGVAANISQIIGVVVQLLSTGEIKLSPWIILIPTTIGVLTAGMIVLQSSRFTQLQNEKTQKIKQTAKIVLVITVFTFITFSTIQIYNYFSQKKLTIVVANFTEQGGGNSKDQTQSLLIYNEIKSATATEKDIEVIYLPNALSELNSDEAKKIGKKYNAAIVIWGWYTIRQNEVLINPELELLTKYPISQPLQLSQEIVSRNSYEDFRSSFSLSGEYSYISTSILGTIRYSQNRFSDAVNIFSRVIEENKTAENIFIIYNLRGLSYSNNGMHQYALNDFIHATQLNPTNATLYYNLGSSQKKLNDIPNAISSFNQAIQLDNNFAPAYNSLGIIYFETNELLLAESYFRQAIQLNPYESVYRSNLADVYFNQGLYDLALNQVEKGLETNFSDDYLHLLKYLILLKRGDYLLAIPDFFLNFYYSQPTQTITSLLFISSFLIFGAIDSKLKGKISNKIITKTLLSGSSLALKVLGFEKRSSLKNYYQLNTAAINAAALLRYKALSTSGDEVKSTKFLESCVARGLRDKKLLVTLGITYFNRDDFNLAYQLFTDVLKIDKNNEHACYGLAWIYSNQGKHLDSLMYYKKAAISNLYGKESWLSVGDICWKINDARGAFIAWEKAVKKDAQYVINNAMKRISTPDSFLSYIEHYKLGLAFQQKGNKQNAQKGYEIAYTLGSHTPISLQAKIKLQRLKKTSK